MRAASGQFRPSPGLWKAALSLAAFSTLGGVGGAMLTGEPLVGAGAYCALTILGLCSPEGAALRGGARIASSAPAPRDDEGPRRLQ